VSVEFALGQPTETKDEDEEFSWPRAAAIAPRGRTIADLSPGLRAVVLKLGGRGAIRQRLMDMGLLPSVPIRVVRVAPTGDPIWITVGTVHLSLRRVEASAVVVE
jgi:Fe2+ transport system protein FeoA